MQNSKILSVTGLVMVLMALVAHFAVARVVIPAAHPLPVETFPRQIGDWTAGPDLPTDEEVQQKLKTATLVTRVYSNSAGQSVELLLLTAKLREDFHDPNLCFPGHGWQLSEQTQTHVEEQKINSMVATQEGNSDYVWYWWEGEIDFERQAGRPAHVQELRQTIYNALDRVDSMSLFVRIIAPHTPKGKENLETFTRAILNPIHQLAQRPGAVQPSSVR